MFIIIDDFRIFKICILFFQVFCIDIYIFKLKAYYLNVIGDKNAGTDIKLHLKHNFIFLSLLVLLGNRWQLITKENHWMMSRNQKSGTCEAKLLTIVLCQTSWLHCLLFCGFRI